MTAKPIQSPSYPSLSLEAAVEGVQKIEQQYRSSPADRIDAAKLLGFSAGSGPANMALAALASYGLVERAGKGMLRVTPLARAILHPQSDNEKATSLKTAASTPRLYQEIRDHFQDLDVPPESGVITYLNRRGFNPSAIPTAAKAFLATAKWVKELSVTENRGSTQRVEADSKPSDTKCGNAQIGDFVQWESGGALQFETPRRIRWVSDDLSHVAVDRSDTGIAMSEVFVVTAPAGRAQPPQSPPPSASLANTPAKDGKRTAIFPVSEGDVTFIFPEDMSVEGIEELEAYLAVFLKKEKRNAGAK
jgi:hypothetical protein